MRVHWREARRAQLDNWLMDRTRTGQTERGHWGEQIENRVDWPLGPSHLPSVMHLEWAIESMRSPAASETKEASSVGS